MNPRRFLLIAVTLTGVWLGLSDNAGAHRLDEYLQAARFSVERNCVRVEIDLTPGITVVPQVVSLIDTNHDGRISPAEADAYARQVFNSIELTVDKVAVPVTL